MLTRIRGAVHTVLDSTDQVEDFGRCLAIEK
jgi:hypothetical protein